MGLLPSKNNRRGNNTQKNSNGQPGNNTPENSNQKNNKPGNNRKQKSNFETLTLSRVLKPIFKEERKKILVNIPSLEMNNDTLTDDQISKYLLKHYSKIDFNDNVINKNTRTTFINSTLKIFLDIIWEYLIYRTIDTENKLETICDEKILNIDVEQTSKEYISSKNIHTCFNIIQEIDKIEKNFEKDQRYYYKYFSEIYPDYMRKYNNYQHYRDSKKK